MHHDARMYIEIRYDGQSADAVLAVFRDRGTLPIEVLSEEFSFESPELTDDHYHEAVMNLLRMVQVITARR